MESPGSPTTPKSSARRARGRGCKSSRDERNPRSPGAPARAPRSPPALTGTPHRVHPGIAHPQAGPGLARLRLSRRNFLRRWGRCFRRAGSPRAVKSRSVPTRRETAAGSDCGTGRRRRRRLDWRRRPRVARPPARHCACAGPSRPLQLQLPGQAPCTLRRAKRDCRRACRQTSGAPALSWLAGWLAGEQRPSLREAAAESWPTVPKSGSLVRAFVTCTSWHSLRECPRATEQKC